MVSALAAGALARSMVRPIRTLDEGARRIGAGDLDQQIVVRTGDELEGLADQFNRMSGQLRESYAGLERKVDAAHGRGERGAGLPDRDQRGAARDQQLADRRARRCSRRSWKARASCSAPRPPPCSATTGSWCTWSRTHGWSGRGAGGRAPALPRAAEPGHDQRPRHPVRCSCRPSSTRRADPPTTRPRAKAGHWRRMIGAPMLKDGVAGGRHCRGLARPGRDAARGSAIC